MAKILIAGCSYASGWGLEQEQHSTDLWCNILFERDTVVNIATPGANNHWIFLQTAQALRNQSFDKVFVAWTAIPRYHFRVGLELYCTDTKLTSDNDIHTVANQTCDRNWQQSTGDRLRKIHNDHWDILDLVHYVNILSCLEKNIWFINSLLPWSKNYFDYRPGTTVPELDSYTANILQSDLRDDSETLELYHHIHDSYIKAGGIHASRWLNLYQSFDSCKIDTISAADHHPAIQSHRTFAELLRTELCTQQN